MTRDSARAASSVCQRVASIIAYAADVSDVSGVIRDEPAADIRKSILKVIQVHSFYFSKNKGKSWKFIWEQIAFYMQIHRENINLFII